MRGIIYAFFDTSQVVYETSSGKTTAGVINLNNATTLALLLTVISLLSLLSF
jgi:hypothetical protein